MKKVLYFCSLILPLYDWIKALIKANRDLEEYRRFKEDVMHVTTDPADFKDFFKRFNDVE